MNINENNAIDSMRVEGEENSSARLLAAIEKAHDYYNAYQSECDQIDEVYARDESFSSSWFDQDYDLFWSSMEVMKPSIYARMPRPSVSPQFNDRRPLYVTTAEILERSILSVFDASGLDESLLAVRDDLLFYNRGVLWLSYSTEGGKRIYMDHVDRRDFLLPPARRFSEVPWGARRSWLSREQVSERFGKDVCDRVRYTGNREGGDLENDGRASVWEIWHKADNRVYWVSEGCDVILDSAKPHHDLTGFFPFPRPAFGTLRNRTLRPIPDYSRYASLFKQVNRLTARIYDLLDMVRLRGLIPAGSEIGDAVEQLMRETSSASMLIPVPGALISGGTSEFVQWVPLDMLTTTISALIQARSELMADFDRLSGVSDIMRGETEASETLGAQQLKSQYGSVRVKGKCDEIVRLSRDATRIAAEMIAENYDVETLLDLSLSELPSKAEVAKSIKEVEKSATEELKAAHEQALKAVQSAGPDGAEAAQVEAEKAFNDAKNDIAGRHSAELKKLEAAVTREDFMRLLKDSKARAFAFDIETDSTVLADEAEAKASATEFYSAVMTGMSGMQQAAAMGEEAVRMAAEVMKYALAPYRPTRAVIASVDEFLNSAGDIAKRSATEASQQDATANDEAMKAMGEAELQKAQAQMMKAQADAQIRSADLQAKVQEAQTRAQQDQQRFQLEVAKSQGTVEETAARIEKIYAEIQALGVQAETSARNANVNEAKIAADIQHRQSDLIMRAEDAAHGRMQAEVNNARADRAEASAAFAPKE